jgi:GPI ethanolamine phosphate transferase 1
MTEVKSNEPISKRVVLIVSDGLNANSFFNPKNEEDNYLLNLIKNKNAKWGISHTRVPTESRPCHLAMLGGFYEDMSNIFTGWKENKETFDTVFNKTKYVLQMGSPDVLNIFKGSNIESYSYDASFEGFKFL